MAQAAVNGEFTFAKDVWVLLSETNCTFINLNATPIEVIGDVAQPDQDVGGVPYNYQQGEEAGTDVLARYPGAAGGSASGIYIMSRGRKGRIFLSREAVA